MKITVLVDNNTMIDRYLFGEPGLSLLIQDSGINILLDVGYSDIFLKNAQKLGANIYEMDYIAISHGHSDHTWGLVPLLRLYTEAILEKKEYNKPTLLAHSQAFEYKFGDKEAIGSIIEEKMLNNFFNMNLRKDPFWITEKLVFLGEIERVNSFENKEPIGKWIDQGVEKDDFIRDDTALAYKSKDGLVIITGCSHSGICNIIEYAKKICNENRVVDIVGGLHLLNPSKEQMELTKSYIKQAGLKALHACHCTDLSSKLALSEVAQI
ncbi:MAG TPA: MBL fold metallo-hydrolase, partial [Patescibacteria group bacterium]|nr:MBL fold metallo-hydrolase [Patescibacteria group bacterium]